LVAMTHGDYDGMFRILCMMPRAVWHTFKKLLMFVALFLHQGQMLYPLKIYRNSGTSWKEKFQGNCEFF
jgi:hypothetical protein